MEPILSLCFCTPVLGMLSYTSHHFFPSEDFCAGAQGCQDFSARTTEHFRSMMVCLQQGSGCGFNRTPIKRSIIRLLAAVLCLASPSVAPAPLPLTSLAYHLSPVPVVDWPQRRPFSAASLFGGGASRQETGTGTDQDAFRSFPDLDINSPVILRGLPVVRQWAAFGKWDIRYLRRLRASPRIDTQNEDGGLGAKRKTLQLKGVYKKSDGYFGPIWDEGKPMASLPSVEWFDTILQQHCQTCQ